MKKQLLLLSVLLAAIPLFGQADLQWLVLKGMGKNSTTNSNTTNNYSNPFGANTFFNLDGILHPDLTNFEYNKNDIFIIYQDGTFYNSRKKNSVVPDKGFFYDPDMDNVNHSFESDKPIQYLYLSNIYERDDPPQGVGLKQGRGKPTMKLIFIRFLPLQHHYQYRCRPAMT